jgi:hypothetical protein
VADEYEVNPTGVTAEELMNIIKDGALEKSGYNDTRRRLFPD